MPPEADSVAAQSQNERGYVNISDHSLIGNLRTAALISTDGSVESYCLPDFDSPSVFARILDKDKGGHFSITPKNNFHTKQSYFPSSNVLGTKFLNDEGVANVVDFLPRPSANSNKPLLFWLIRRVEIIRGRVPIRVECAPAFNYAQHEHSMDIVPDDSVEGHQDKVVFRSSNLSLDLRYIVDECEGAGKAKVIWQELDLTAKGHKGKSVCCDLELVEGQAVTFVLREMPGPSLPKPSEAQAEVLGIPLDVLMQGASKMRPRDDPVLTEKLLQGLLKETNKYWTEWIGRSTYRGSWREAVHRSALALKLLIYEPTGAIVASPTFSLPEFLGGTRNWDYRFTWIRDSSFTLYALIRLGFTDEATAFTEFVFSRIGDRNADGSLQIMYTIHGDKDLEEYELNHLDGHKGSKPVRIGNGAANHLQLDIYGELMDCIYLSQKYGKPLGYDLWLAVRELVDYVVKNVNRQDLSIWEVRSKERNFTYSKVMMWVAIDRGLRLSEKRSLPLPQREVWIKTRDALYEEIMEKSWNPEKGYFGQSYEENHILDSAVLVMPLVFFSPAAEPRFLSTLKHILKSPDKGGLTANNLVFRYDVRLAEDGVGGEEGAFSLCTLWAVEALTRAGQFDKNMLSKAVAMFEDFLGYGNHCGLFTEEISPAGEGLGNAVQGFTHVTLISAAFNLSRTLGRLGSA
jgi:GH15 family glucan-1,4-alpha-glucosidase